MAESRARYTTVAIILHWAIALLIIFMLPFGHYMTDLPRGSFERLAAFQAHYSIGITILVLTLARLVWRFMHPAPKLPSTMKPAEKMLAKAAHYLFYVLLIALPLAGWATATTSSLGTPIYFFDLFQVPWFPGLYGLESREIVHEVFEEMHKTGGSNL